VLLSICAYNAACQKATPSPLLSVNQETSESTMQLLLHGMLGAIRIQCVTPSGFSYPLLSQQCCGSPGVSPWWSSSSSSVSALPGSDCMRVNG